MIANLLIVIAWLYLIIGMIGIYKFKDLLYRLLTSSTVDTVAAITILIALILYIKDFSYIIKIILLILFILITNPISNHVIIRSAFMSGITVNKEQKNGDIR